MNGPSKLVASVVITTFNRADALALTLARLADQTLPAADYEILVTNDGSTDGTDALLAAADLACELRTFRHEVNRGIAAGRNLAIGHARGDYIVMVSDDVLVPRDFLALHISTLRRFPGYWVVGGFEQLGSLTDTAFGRYLDRLERGFEQERKAAPVEANIWEMTWPSARNLSLPRVDLAVTGVFDEQFRSACEDQDLAHHARQAGIGFLYNADITCLHNDQVADLARCCAQQRRFGHDTVLFCAKRPEVHGDFEVLRANRRWSIGDGPLMTAKKAAKVVLSRDPVLRRMPKVAAAGERLALPDAVLFRIYQGIIGLHILRGVREGFESLRRLKGEDAVRRLGSHTRV